MFILLAACELHGVKHNMEIGFPKPPSMAELIGHVESTFQIENRLMRPPTNRQKLPFRLQHIQVFDAVLQRWVDLLSSTQLHPWTQLYVFQYSSPSKTERPAQLSATRPIRSVQANSAAEKLWLLFQDVDVNGNGYIERDELQRVFSALGLFAFSESQVDGVFASADTNRDGVLSYAEVSKDVPPLFEDSCSQIELHRTFPLIQFPFRR
ncbi:hypothetical protein DIPPA_07777 [Diplonema papillatum]|nr:hypothetical protein DIPPA_07777 [Diplonema papillatum]